MHGGFAVIAGADLQILHRAEPLFDAWNIGHFQPPVFIGDDLKPAGGEIKQLAAYQ